jgi:ABC-type transport system substrate-binding protein
VRACCERTLQSGDGRSRRSAPCFHPAPPPPPGAPAPQLRRGVYFHDGTPVDAFSLAFNFDAIWYPSTGVKYPPPSLHCRPHCTTTTLPSWKHGDIGTTMAVTQCPGMLPNRTCPTAYNPANTTNGGFRAVDEYTLTVTTFYPYSPLLSEVAGAPFLFMSPWCARQVPVFSGFWGITQTGHALPWNSAAMAGATLGNVTRSCGTGPWVLSQRSIGAWTLFTRNDAYWGALPRFSQLVVTVGADGLDAADVPAALAAAPSCPSPSPSALSGGAIAGIVVATVAFVVALAVMGVKLMTVQRAQAALYDKLLAIESHPTAGTGARPTV